jgi:hypothetical protein
LLHLTVIVLYYGWLHSISILKIFLLLQYCTVHLKIGLFVSYNHITGTELTGEKMSVAYLNALSYHLLQGTKDMHESLSQDTWNPTQDSNQAPPKFNSELILLDDIFSLYVSSRVESSVAQCFVVMLL